MRKTTIASLMMLPIMSMAQEPGLFDSPTYKAQQYFESHIGWPLLGFIIASICALALVTIIIRKRMRRGFALSVVMVYLTFAAWYFYPALTFKGTYSASIREEILTISIDESYHSYGGDEFSYKLMPFQRMLWLDIQIPDLNLDFIPIKMGCDKIYHPVIKEGLVEFQKTK